MNRRIEKYGWKEKESVSSIFKYFFKGNLVIKYEKSNPICFAIITAESREYIAISKEYYRMYPILAKFKDVHPIIKEDVFFKIVKTARNEEHARLIIERNSIMEKLNVL